MRADFQNGVKQKAYELDGQCSYDEPHGEARHEEQVHEVE